ncbi:MAG: hypothetical protein WDA27_01445 [Actinomycetota bacterium]
MRRVRELLGAQAGASVAEAVVAGAIFLVVLTPILSSMTTAERSEKLSTNLSRAVDDARSALDGLAKEVRSADALRQGGGAGEALAWYDVNHDAVQQSSEIVTYAVVRRGSGWVLTRAWQAATRVLVTGVQPSSTLRVTAANQGVVMRLSLWVDVSPHSAPGATLVETEVLARNA